MRMGRFSVSGRSKKYADTAIAEELIIDKETGQFLVKSVDGERVVSLDATTTQANHQRTLSTIAMLKGFTGDIYKVPVTTSLPMPCVIGSSDVLIPTPLDLTALSLYESFMVSVDAVIVDQTDQLASINPEVTITLELTLSSNETQEVVKTGTSTQTSVNVFTLSDLKETYGQITKVVLKSITFNADELSDTTQLVILNDVLIFVESGE